MTRQQILNAINEGSRVFQDTALNRTYTLRYVGYASWLLDYEGREDWTTMTLDEAVRIMESKSLTD